MQLKKEENAIAALLLLHCFKDSVQAVSSKSYLHKIVLGRCISDYIEIYRAIMSFFRPLALSKGDSNHMIKVTRHP